MSVQRNLLCGLSDLIRRREACQCLVMLDNKNDEKSTASISPDTFGEVSYLKELLLKTFPTFFFSCYIGHSEDCITLTCRDT